ncbi:MAG: hypothetical protein IJW40_05830 [Clostridia bacterium]|nr:hypothetical protein [Clostridia bacterium]
MDGNNDLRTDFGISSLLYGRKKVAASLNSIFRSGSETDRIRAIDVGTARLNARINLSLKHRGIEYRISRCYTSVCGYLLMLLIVPYFIMLHQCATAINLLAEDHNYRNA